MNDEFGMFSFFEMTPDLVCFANKEGFFEKVNPAAISKFGYTEQELFSKPISAFIHPADTEFTKQKRADLINGNALVNFQNRYISKNGNVIWLEWTSIYLPDKELVFALAKDISKSKQKEIEIEEKFNKFKLLASHFKSHLEEDRKYFAFELHGELAQLVAVIKMNISWMKVNVPEVSDEFKKRMDEVLVITDLFIMTVRRISFSISPYMLEDFGFNATAEWQCKEFSALNDICCEFISTCKEEDIPTEVKIDFFRICQEALSNINLHANARNVKVSVDDMGDAICLTITDDGKGFDLQRKSNLTGITKMQQRAVSLNSELIIESNSGNGTKILLSVVK